MSLISNRVPLIFRSHFFFWFCGKMCALLKIRALITRMTQVYVAQNNERCATLFGYNIIHTIVIWAFGCGESNFVFFCCCCCYFAASNLCSVIRFTCNFTTICCIIKIFITPSKICWAIFYVSFSFNIWPDIIWWVCWQMKIAVEQNAMSEFLPIL